MSADQLTPLRDQLEADLLEHRRGFGATRTREAAERRIRQDYADAEATLTEMVEEARHAAIVGSLSFKHRYGIGDPLINAAWRDLLLEAVARPASASHAEVLATYT